MMQTYTYTSQFVQKNIHDQVILIVFNGGRETEFLLLGLWDTLESAPWIRYFHLSYTLSLGPELSVTSFLSHINM